MLNLILTQLTVQYYLQSIHIKEKIKGDIMSNPFTKNSTQYKDWEILKDLKWHCTKCELNSAQAKTWQVWRQKGIQFETDEKGNWYKWIDCPSCGNRTVHRKLKNLEILNDESYIRQGISPKLRERVLGLYKCTEAMLLRKYESRLLEVDHKFPQIRWDSDEQNLDNLTDADIKNKFILLTRENNLLKSRQCEKCYKTEIRGTFPGIYYWYEGNQKWDAELNDEKGCVGCFWYDPHRWRKELNKIITEKLKK